MRGDVLRARKNDETFDGLPAGQTLADAADRLRGHAEIRREHRLRHATSDRRVNAKELEVPLLRRGAQRADDALVLRGGMTLQAVPECSRIRRHPNAEAPM